MRRVLIAALLLLPGAVCFAQAKTPVVSVAKDGYPNGHATPEGVACDFVRASINHDATLFKITCIAPFGGDKYRKGYEGFLKKMGQSIAAEKKKTTPSPYGPKTIDRVYAARHLSKEGPASYGYTVFAFKDVQFVDVAVTQQNGRNGTYRALVVQNADGRWYVHPAPESDTLLSAGLNQESVSKKAIPRKR